MGRRKVPALVSVTASEKGSVRPENQDAVFADDEARVYAVADGMGGGAEGARASATVVGRIRAAVSATSGRDLPARLEALADALERANAEIHSYAATRGYRQMGTTVALIVFDPEDAGQAVIGYVGDSRVYRLRAGSAEQLSVDHTVGAELSSLGSVRLQDVSRHHLQHVLTRAIGPNESVRVDWRRVQLQAGDRFLLCSDGVHNVISAEQLSLFAGGGIADVRARLSTVVEARGAPDNYSYVVIDQREAS